MHKDIEACPCISVPPKGTIAMILTGISGSRGIAAGKVYVYSQEDIVIPEQTTAPEESAQELKKLEAGMEATLAQLGTIRQKALENMGEKEAAIFDAHIMITQDPALTDAVKALIETEHASAAAAVRQTIDTYAGMFLTMEDPYMRERGADIRDIGDRLLRNVLGMAPRGLAHLTDEVILVANDLTPSDTAALDKSIVKAFITASGGPTSHAAIMARTLEIPAIMGAGDISSLTSGQTVIVDGVEGKVIVNPDAEELAAYTERAAAFKARQQELKNSASLPAVTRDGHQVLLFGNIGKASDSRHAVHLGAEGIGLFRTEFLYMESDALPSENTQFEAYRQAAEDLRGNPVIIRTMDIGGDKELKSLGLPTEMNPFLGYRAIRICLDRPDMFKEQLKALLRASAFGDVQIMYPMISGLEEVRRANMILSEAKAELRADGIAFNENIPVGIMVEIPSTAVMADLFAKEVDFFSIGTNDLCQYTLAVDRMNENIGHLYQPLHPAVLRLIKMTIDASHKEKKITGMCGEMAGDPLATMILLGLGLDEFSMNAAALPAVKNILRSVTYAECQEAANQALNMSTAEDVAALAKELLDRNGIIY